MTQYMTKEEHDKAIIMFLNDRQIAAIRDRKPQTESFSIHVFNLLFWVQPKVMFAPDAEN